MASRETLIDGNFLRASEINAPRFQYPFRQNGDRVSALFEQDYWQTKATFAPQALSIPHESLRDYYLIAESDPVELIAGLYQFTRTYARIPAEQSVPSSMFITKPDIPGTFPQLFGGYVIRKPVDSVASYDAYTALTVASDSGAPSVSRPTSGTTVATLDGSSTSSTAYTATSATWQTNLNAVSTISGRGSCVVSGGPLSTTDLTVTFNSYAALTLDTSSLTADTGAAPLSSINISAGGFTQVVSIKAKADNGGTPAQSNTLSFATDFPGIPNTLVATAAQNTMSDGARSALAWNFAWSGGGYFNGGTYTLSAYGDSTAAIPYNADAATIGAAITAGLTTLGTHGSLDYSLISVNTIAGRITSINIIVAVTPRFTGGTLTATLFGDTTSTIAYNASLTTIQTKLNGLAGVTARDGCTIPAGSVTSTEIRFTVQFTNPLLSFSTSSLGPAGLVATVTSGDGGINRIQVVSILSATTVRTLSVTIAHGISLTDAIFILAGTTYYFLTTGFVILSTDSVGLTLDAGAALSAAGTITQIGRRAITGYAPNATLSRIKRVTKFYLPGITPGVATADDIPLPIYQGDPSSFLTAIFSRATSINIQIGDQTQWRDSPIIASSTIVLNAATLT